MLSHYVKVSFRELLKYRTQSIVSIIGLAVGFTTFILGGYWLWWETHFDNFHPEARPTLLPDDDGLVKRANGTQSDLDQLHINDREELFKLLPEIEASCSFNHLSFTLETGQRSNQPAWNGKRTVLLRPFPDRFYRRDSPRGHSRRQFCHFNGTDSPQIVRDNKLYRQGSRIG